MYKYLFKRNVDYYKIEINFIELFETIHGLDFL